MWVKISGTREEYGRTVKARWYEGEKGTIAEGFSIRAMQVYLSSKARLTSIWNLCEPSGARIPLYNACIQSGFVTVAECKRKAEKYLKSNVAGR